MNMQEIEGFIDGVGSTNPLPLESAQHIYHHSDSDGVRISVKVEKNTKGFNYEASVSGAKTPEEALEVVKKVQKSLELQYGGPPPAV